MRKEADHIGWTKYFTKLVGADDTSRDKPFPDPVELAMAGSGVTLGRDVWFVGDSVVDMEVAHVTGCVPVWYGELPKEKLSHDFEHRFANHKEMQAALKQVFGAS